MKKLTQSWKQQKPGSSLKTHPSKSVATSSPSQKKRNENGRTAATERCGFGDCPSGMASMNHQKNDIQMEDIPQFNSSFDDLDFLCAVKDLENQDPKSPQDVKSATKDSTRSTPVGRSLKAQKNLHISTTETATPLRLRSSTTKANQEISKKGHPKHLHLETATFPEDDMENLSLEEPICVSTPTEDYQSRKGKKGTHQRVTDYFRPTQDSEITGSRFTLKQSLFKDILNRSGQHDRRNNKTGCETGSGSTANLKQSVETRSSAKQNDDYPNRIDSTHTDQSMSRAESKGSKCLQKNSAKKQNKQPTANEEESQGFDTSDLPAEKPSTSHDSRHAAPVPSRGPTDRLQLSAWGLPECVLAKYRHHGITTMFEWQAECLCTGTVLDGGNLVYSAPTSAGKTMVAELLMLKRVLETKKKAILILPFVSVAREKMHYLQGLFQDAGVRVDGYMGSSNPAGGFSSVDIAVCTIEKANSLINRLLEENRLDQLGIIVVDELHMVGDPHRGYLLELLLTKVRFMVSKATVTQTKDEDAEGEEQLDNNVQIVGMSATLPNLDLLAGWLNAALYRTDYRPVPLTETVKVGKDIFDCNMKKLRTLDTKLAIKGDDEHIIPLCLETILDGNSVLIFCPTKNWCEKLAETIAREFWRLNKEAVTIEEGFVKASEVVRVPVNQSGLRDVVEQLRRSPAGLDPMLGRVTPYGVAYHHAGLTFDERDIVEGAFRQGALRVLVATSTLSSGVNLPARRVIVRTPIFHGTIVNTLSYKQMVGRAGRKGVDTCGESVLVCKPNERPKAAQLLQSDLPPVKSCLVRSLSEGLSSSLKRAILEIVVSGVAASPAEVTTYANCTMLAASLAQDAQAQNEAGEVSEPAQVKDTAIQECINFLQESEFITLRKMKDKDGIESERFQATQLGAAVLASALGPDEGLVVFAELQKARRCFVLENELHIIYLVTPIYTSDQWSTIDWYQYLCQLEQLPPDMQRVAELVGVRESFLTKAVRGRIPLKTIEQVRLANIHKRFYTTLILNELVSEVPLSQVARKYNCNKGMLQSLQQSAATFSGMVTVFCNRLGWTNLEMLLSAFQSRLTFGVQKELVDLVRISALNGQRARVMYNGGYQTVAALATADPVDIELLLKNSAPFESKKRGEGETEWEARERLRSRCIWLPGQKGLTESEAAVLIVEEAKKHLQDDMGQLGIEWKPPEAQPKKAKLDPNKKSFRHGILSPSSPKVKKKRRSASRSPKNQRKDSDRASPPSTFTAGASRRKSSLPSCSILSPPPGFRSPEILNLPSKTVAASSVSRQSPESTDSVEISIRHTHPDMKIDDASVSPGTSNREKTSLEAAGRLLDITIKHGKIHRLRDASRLGTPHNRDSVPIEQSSHSIVNHSAVNIVKTAEVSPNSDADDAFGDSFILDTQTANIMSNLSSSSLPGASSEAHVTAPELDSPEMYSEPVNDELQQLPKPTETSFAGESMQAGDDSPMADYMQNFCTQNDVVAKSASPLLPPTQFRKSPSPGPSTMAELDVGVIDPRLSLENSLELLPASNYEKLEGVGTAEDVRFTEEDADDDILANEIPLRFQKNPASEKLTGREMNNKKVSRKREKFPEMASSEELKESIEVPQQQTVPVYSDFEEDLQLAFDMGDSFPSTALVDLTKILQEGNSEKNPGSSTKTPNARIEKENGRDTDGAMNQALTFSMMENLLEDSVEAEATPAAPSRSKVKVGHHTPSGQGRKKVESAESICFSPDTDAMLNAIFDDDIKSGTSFHLKKGHVNTPSGQVLRRSKRRSTEKVNTDVSPPKQERREKESKGKRGMESANKSLNDSKNESISSDYVPPTPPDQSVNENSKTATPRRLVGGVLGTPKRETRTPGRNSGRNSTKETKEVVADQLATNCNKKGQTNIEQPVMSSSSIMHHSPTPSMPCTNQSFTIIDVAANRMLFEHFLKEWQSKESYAVCLACEKLPAQQPQDGGIGSNFRKGTTPVPRSNQGAVEGFTVEGREVVVVGLSVTWENRDAYYVALTQHNVDCDLDESLAPPPIDPSLSVTERLKAVQSVLQQQPTGQRSPVRVMTFDLKDQYKLLSQACGIVLEGSFEDPRVADWVLDPGAKEKNLHRMVTNYLSYEGHLLEGLGGGIGWGSLGLSPQNPGSGRVRAAVEGVLVLRLMEYLHPRLEDEGLLRAFTEIEMPSVALLAKMELNGMGFSQADSDSQKSVMQAKLAALEERAYKVAGHPFSLSSPEDVAQVLFVEQKLPPTGDPSAPNPPSKTLGPARGKGSRGRHKTTFSTAKDIMEKLKPLHPLPGMILEWRRISSAISKVVYPLQRERVYNQRVDMDRIYGVSHWHTATGRVTMQEPNLQNVPKDFDIEMPGLIGESPPQKGLDAPLLPGKVNTRTSRSRASAVAAAAAGPRQSARCLPDNPAPLVSISMRDVFVPFRGGSILAADYSQLELRMIAHLSKDPSLIRILNKGGDVFKTIAAQWKKVEVSEVTPQQRQQAKQVCYGMIYGIGAKALGEQLGVEENDAAVFIETFKARYTGMRTYLRQTVQRCREKGYVETIVGRRRYLPAIKDVNPHSRAHAERQAVNTTVQGSAADLVKKAMVDIDRELAMAFPDTRTCHRHNRHGPISLTEGSRRRSRRLNQSNPPPRGAFFILQLHDELIYEVSQQDIGEVAAIVQRCMEKALPLSVVLPVKIKAGPSWGKLEDFSL